MRKPATVSQPRRRVQVPLRAFDGCTYWFSLTRQTAHRNLQRFAQKRGRVFNQLRRDLRAVLA